MAKVNIVHKLFALGPLFLLYYLSISEIDTNLEKLFEVFSLNLQIIIIYFWIIKRPSLMGTGHIFFAGDIQYPTWKYVCCEISDHPISNTAVIFLGRQTRIQHVRSQIYVRR